MVITPDSKVKLIKNPLKLDNNNELMFANATSQYNYFTSLPKLEFDSLTYVRKDGVLRIETDDDLTYEDLLEYNFCMYQNTHFDNKWFYAFITDITWVNPSLVDIKIETAYFQTWQFDLVFKDSFIEREHVNNDTIGYNLVDEGLELGEYTCNGHHIDTNMNNILTDLCYIVGSTIGTILDGDKFPAVGGDVYNGLYSGVKYYRYDSTSAIDIVLQAWASKGQSDGTTGIFMAPKVLAPLNTQSLEREVLSTNSTQNYNISMTKNYGLQGYIPRNNKLKTFPFCYMLVSNNQGGNAIYHYEDFSTSNCEFIVKGALTPGCSIRMTPTNYKGATENDEESINLGKFPICNYTVDMYTNWLTQNSVNLTTQSISNGLQIASGLALMGSGAGALAGVGMISNGLLGITNTMGEIRKASLVPPQVNGNLNSGDVITASSKNNFHFYNMSIKSQYASMIDNYFSMFGYKVNRLGTPHLHVRTYYDYIKTIDVNIEGDLPEADLNQIRNMFNNGIRFWHDTTKYLDFSVNNTIIS